MDKELIEKYRQEMLRKYGGIKPSAPALSKVPTPYSADTSSTGRLIGIVTSFNSLFPVEGALVSVWTGDINHQNVIKTLKTDQSGRTEAFVLPAPAADLSLNQSNTLLPYALYNMTVSAEGFVDSVHLNIPVFSGVTSLQTSDLTLLDTASPNTEAEIYDEAQNYGL